MKTASREFLRIVGLSVGAAVIYGLIHDQITARVCIEYFTIAHPPVVISNLPTVQGLVWGVIATWWAGALIGVPLAVVARVGAYPQWNAAQLVRPVALLMTSMAICALISGLTGYFLASTGQIKISPGWAGAIAPQQHIKFVAVAWAHNASYLAGFVGGFVLIFRVWNVRCGDALRAGLG